MRYRVKEKWQDLERMTEEKISYREFADRAGVSLSSVQKMVDGSDLKMSTIERIARFLGVRIKDLLIEPGDTDYKE